MKWIDLAIRIATLVIPILRRKDGRLETYDEAKRRQRRELEGLP